MRIRRSVDSMVRRSACSILETVSNEAVTKISIGRQVQGAPRQGASYTRKWFAGCRKSALWGRRN